MSGIEAGFSLILELGEHLLLVHASMVGKAHWATRRLTGACEGVHSIPCPSTHKISSSPSLHRIPSATYYNYIPSVVSLLLVNP